MSGKGTQSLRAAIDIGWATIQVGMTSQPARATFLLTLLVPFAAAFQTELPDGKGKDVVESACSDCHSLARVKEQRLDEEGWNSVIHEMIENGAAINANDLPVIVSYLSKNFGPDKDKKISINKIKADEIVQRLGLTASEADAVVRYRTEHGKFKDLSELEKASGAADKIEAKKALVEFD